MPSFDSFDSRFIGAAFDRVTRRMEQHRGEIEPFVTWLLSTLRRRPHVVMEIGVRHGGTAQLWCELAIDTVIGVDWGLADSLGRQEQYALGRDMESEYPHKYQFMLADSHSPDTLDMLSSRLGIIGLDLLFLDGDHSYDGVKQDYEMYRGLVRRGGVIAFHDIVDTPLIRSAGHGVYRFWQELPGDKHEFCVGGDWGGIGAIIV